MVFRSRLLIVFSLFLAAAHSGLVSGQTLPPDESARIKFFETKVRPVLANNCYNCHSANNKTLGGLRVDDRNGLLQGGNRGPAVIPGDPGKSLILQAVRHEGKVKMPPEKHISEQEITDLTQWVRDGAAWPKVEIPVSLSTHPARYDRMKKEHWAFQPVAKTAVPAVKDNAWARDDIDRFILAKLEEKKLRPVADADRLTLLRRVTFDLTGLPPTLAEIDAFLQDDSPIAFEKAVDRLLASPAFGERWGRHWLDVARYGESTGSSRNIPYPHAWRYRDYVIGAFNSDKPFDQFTREQVAGDLLPANSPEERDQHLIATGFLALGVKDVNQRFKVRFVMDNIDEQIDTVTRSLLALTASCARCHDHKYDPIPTTDYYALAGIFHSTDHCSAVRNKMGGGGLDYYDPALLLRLSAATTKKVDPQTAEKIARLEKLVAEAKADFESIKDTPLGKSPAANGKPAQLVARQKMEKLQSDLRTLMIPISTGPVALGVRDAKNVSDIEVRIRGEAELLGPVVPRGFLSFVPVADAPKINPNQSGRLELAQWLTSPNNPLTARVMVNRVWHHLFGRGLVSSVDNFGVTGDTPTHPELLDHLANRFVNDGWSVKKLVRAVVLSRAYQLSSETTPAHIAADPANRLVWRHSPRRLDAEEIRDAILAASGKLNLTPLTGSPAESLVVKEINNNGAEAKQIGEAANKSLHRSVYLPLLRGLTPGTLEVFDFAEQGMVTGNRDTTTVAPQALFLLNSPFVRQQSTALAERLLNEIGSDNVARIQLAYHLTLGRTATPQEVERVTSYLAAYEAEARKEKATDPRAAAWASFSQALIGSAEFRYLR
jgi:hypothetical protein